MLSLKTGHTYMHVRVVPCIQIGGKVEEWKVRTGCWKKEKLAWLLGCPYGMSLCITAGMCHLQSNRPSAGEYNSVLFPHKSNSNRLFIILNTSQ